MTAIKKRPLLLLGMVCFVLSLIIRHRTLGLYNLDMDIIIKWYDFLSQRGIGGLGDEKFSLYPPAYLYLLWFTTLFSGWFDSLTSIKLIPTVFDLLSAYMVYRISRFKYEQDKAFFLSGLFFLLPTVMLNSSAWGQIDSLYVSFLLVCFYFLLKREPAKALAAFGIAFSFKAQAIFFLPFLGILFLRKQVKWYHFFLMPLMYVLLALPTVLLGRNWESILFLYGGQLEQFAKLSMFAPNLYLFVPDAYYHPGLEIGMALFTICMAVWALVNWKTRIPVSERQLILTALASLALVPFLLPKMHDRYFYPADVFSFVTALFIPRLWFLPLLYQVMSGLTYTVFLFHLPPAIIIFMTFVNTAITIFIIRLQIRSLRNGNESTTGETPPAST